jgi:hypothetical protein
MNGTCRRAPAGPPEPSSLLFQIVADSLCLSGSWNRHVASGCPEQPSSETYIVRSKSLGFCCRIDSAFRCALRVETSTSSWSDHRMSLLPPLLLLLDSTATVSWKLPKVGFRERPLTCRAPSSSALRCAFLIGPGSLMTTHRDPDAYISHGHTVTRSRFSKIDSAFSQRGRLGNCSRWRKASALCFSPFLQGPDAPPISPA